MRRNEAEPGSLDTHDLSREGRALDLAIGPSCAKSRLSSALFSLEWRSAVGEKAPQNLYGEDC